ncbi:uncharacterized protein RJT20DRAFT_130384, partial [Scheffersomyces xylosifermentans]|uniref:uncharacterized protein n=1 Tax=Scheffersomyces xylosifermentans TaxID=1304137 RepID=UPI00315CA258
MRSSSEYNPSNSSASANGYQVLLSIKRRTYLKMVTYYSKMQLVQRLEDECIFEDCLSMVESFFDDIKCNTQFLSKASRCGFPLDTASLLGEMSESVVMAKSMDRICSTRSPTCSNQAELQCYKDCQNFFLKIAEDLRNVSSQIKKALSEKEDDLFPIMGAAESQVTQSQSSRPQSQPIQSQPSPQQNKSQVILNSASQSRFNGNNSSPSSLNYTNLNQSSLNCTRASRFNLYQTIPRQLNHTSTCRSSLDQTGPNLLNRSNAILTFGIIIAC